MKSKRSHNYLIGSFLLVFFVMLGYTVKFYPEYLTFETPFLKSFPAQFPALAHFFKWITKFGNAGSVAILTLAFLFFLLAQNRKAAGIWLSVNVFIIASLNGLVKLVYLRPRPDLLHQVKVASTSFPSGHAMAAVLLFGTLWVLSKKMIRQKGLRYAAEILAILMILLISASRMYLNVHFPTDILGGWSLGLAWLFFSYPTFQKYDAVERLKQLRH